MPWRPFDLFTSWKTSVVLAFAFAGLAALNLSDGASDPRISIGYMIMAVVWTIAARHEFRRDAR